LLLGEKGVAKVGRPGDIVVQAFQHVWKHHESLDAGVPILLLSGLRKSLTLEPRIPLKPLVCLNHFQRVR
jgi:hypothetical protein